MKKWGYLWNLAFYNLFCLLPVDRRSIVLESEGDCMDNGYGLFHYLESHGYLGKYHVTWMVDHPENFQNTKNVNYVSKDIYKFNIRRDHILARCGYYLYDHFSMFDWKHYRRQKGKKVAYLTHGCGFKAATNDVPCTADEVYITGKVYTVPMIKFCNCAPDAILDLGFPRSDYLFEPIGEKQRQFMAHHGLDRAKKLFLWMPTFRQSSCAAISETYFQSETGLPVLTKEADLLKLDEFLGENRAKCIFKIHHLQKELGAFQNTYKNIMVLKDEDLQAFGLQLYQFIAITDVLITDYSSVSTDYMLLDRPIIYTMDDYEDYKKSRGFSIEDPQKYFVGYHVYNMEQLFQSIAGCMEKDEYKQKRAEVLPEMHTHPDGFAAKRILDHLKITL